MFVCTSLILICKFSGAVPLLHYAVTIFQQSGSTIDPNLSSIIMGCMQVLGLACATCLVDLIGRRTLLLISTICSAICLLVTSFYTYFLTLGMDVTAYNTVPVIFLSLFKFVTNIGIGPLPNILIPELLPRNVRKYDFFFTYKCVFIVFYFLFVDSRYRILYLHVPDTHWCLHNIENVSIVIGLVTIVRLLMAFCCHSNRWICIYHGYDNRN